MSTMQDIADKLGVSKGTVSKALNGASDISETLQKNILDTAIEMGYTKVRRQKSGLRKLCILIDHIEYQKPHQLGYNIILGFRQMAEPAGYTVDIVPASEALQKTISYDAFMLQNDYLGAFVVGFTSSAIWMTDFLTSRTPTVLYENYTAKSSAVAYVGIDSTEAMELAISHLKKLGHRKIGYLSDDLGSYIMQLRHNAFFHALEKAGLDADPALARNSHYIVECMENQLPPLLDMGVTAILCSHDLLANAAMVQCQQLGYHVPEDISIVGFDDLPFCAHTSPPLTAIRQDRVLIGKSGYYALEGLINNIPIGVILLHPQLMTRGSSGNPEESVQNG